MVAPVFISGRTNHRALKTIPLFYKYKSAQIHIQCKQAIELVPQTYMVCFSGAHQSSLNKHNPIQFQNSLNLIILAVFRLFLDGDIIFGRKWISISISSTCHFVRILWQLQSALRHNVRCKTLKRYSEIIWRKRPKFPSNLRFLDFCYCYIPCSFDSITNSNFLIKNVIIAPKKKSQSNYQ